MHEPSPWTQVAISLSLLMRERERERERGGMISFFVHLNNSIRKPDPGPACTTQGIEASVGPGP